MACFWPVRGYRKLNSLLLLLAVSLPSSNINAAGMSNAHRVENLAYGQALFEYFQQNELRAITSLLVAEQKPQSSNQRNESDLLLADLYYGYGLYGESERLFSRLLSDDTDSALLNRVWFNLARLNHDLGYYDQSLELLSRIDDSLPNRLPEQLQYEKQYLLTNLYLGNSKFDDATRAMKSIDQDSIWYQYARYNLGVSLLENKRLDEAQAYLEPLGQLETSIEETLALRDQANLSQGLSLLKNSKPEAALTSFERIRLEGLLSHTALLATGWAWHRLDQFSRALVPWLELAQKNTIDPATQEALLAIPTALEENHKPKLAVQYFELAANQFDKQLELLEQSITTISAGELISLLNQNALIYSGSKFAATSLQSSSAPYLHLLLASSEFQREINRYRQLIDISATLNHWQFNLPTLALMLKERRQAFQKKRPLLELSSNFENLEALKKSRNRFAKQLNQIENTSDHLALATVKEREQLQRLSRVSKTLDNIGDRSDSSDGKDMHRLLYGLLDWQIGTSYAPRLWAAQKQLKSLDRALSIATTRADSLRQVNSNSLQTFDDFDFRIKTQKSKISGLIQRVADLLERQEKHINRIAIAAINAQKQHIVQLRLNARYSLARLYDSMVSE